MSRQRRSRCRRPRSSPKRTATGWRRSTPSATWRRSGSIVRGSRRRRRCWTASTRCSPTTLVAHQARARLHERRAETRAAAEHAARALELARRGAGRVELAAALLARAQTLKATGERSAAADAQAEARATLASCADPGRLARYAEPSAAAPPAIAVAVPVGAPADPLSDRELAVLRLLPGPLSQREIGQELYVSLNTVKTHTRNIYAKLRAANRDEAVGRARELGLI